MIRINRRASRLFALIALVASGLSCRGDGGTSPTKPGEFSIVVESVDTEVGGALVTVFATGLQVVSVPGQAHLIADSTATSRSIVLRGRPGAGTTVIVVRVSDRKSAPTVSVTEVAAGLSGGYAELAVEALRIRVVGPKQ